ncbi:hypothetical protein NPX13_g10485 [Xylaria arbuscula]|uniref:DUF1014-domain-containing protein n=1 Tax=Xylaria arbuscula TaxID=114810 RepID=A0A9W8N4Y5_9PEZI|nr:hypothetical protein NPX13_g10485 [Xylaria arbuscula]
MPPKKGGEGSKKTAGQARKAEAAAAKAQAEEAKKEAAVDADWKRGAKDSSKKQRQPVKKAEKDALLAEEEKNTPGRAQPKNAKTAAKKPSRGIDAALGGLDLNDDNKKLPELGASNIDDAFDVLADVESGGIKIDRHPERRAEALYKAYKEKRMAEMREEGLKLKLSQRTEIIQREWRKHPDNPTSANYSKPKLAYNSTKEEIAEFAKAERERVESKLTVR